MFFVVGKVYSPSKLAQALSDLEKFVHAKDAMPSLVKIGLIHAQFVAYTVEICWLLGKYKSPDISGLDSTCFRA